MDHETCSFLKLEECHTKNLSGTYDFIQTTTFCFKRETENQGGGEGNNVWNNMELLPFDNFILKTYCFFKPIIATKWEILKMYNFL